MAELTLTTRRPEEPVADFAFYIDFKKGEGPASRVFSATHEFIKACELLDRDLVTSIDASIGTVMVLEDIEASSLKTLFHNAIRAADDQALKDIDWKPLVGKYLVRAKYIVLKWMDNDETPRNLPDLGREIQKIAAETDVRHIPDYTPVRPAALIRAIRDFEGVKDHLVDGDRASMVMPDGEEVDFNLSTRLDVDDIESLAIKETQKHLVPVNGPHCPAASTGRCNTSVESLCRCFKPQGFAWPFVELTRHFVQMSLRVYRHVGAFGEVLSEQTISVLIGTPLPWALRITEVDIDVGRQAEPAMVREFLAPVPGQGLVELGRQLPRLPDERGYHCQGFLVGNPYQHHVTRLTFDQGRDVAVLRSRQQITFPVTRHRPIFDRGRALTDRHHVPDLTPANAFPARLFRASDRALRPKMLKQLLLKHTAGLNKQTAIDRLVRHLIRPSSWMRSLEPSGDLLR